jgi:DNA repair exonuclease SbcCD nuclease subunit
VTRIAHFSDTHIGYSAYAALSASGENQRSVDIARAFATVAGEILATDPPLVIHSGDIADRAHISIREMLFLRNWLEKLCSVRPDGSRRQVVVISGNHDQPRSRKEACFLELFRGMPGLHVVTSGYAQIDFATITDAPAELAALVVHTLPHDTLKDLAMEGGFGHVEPVADRENVLVAHGVAGGSELYLRSLGREFTLPGEVINRGWDYVALGHYHKQGPIDAGRGHAWYAGSTETCGFGDLKDNELRRGWLDVSISRGDKPQVTARHITTRTMFRLPLLELDGRSPDQVVEALIANVRAASVSGAVVSQVVTGVSRELWSLVDVNRVRQAAGSALHYEVTPRYSKGDGDTRTEAGNALGNIEQVLDERAKELFTSTEQRDPALVVAKRYLGAALNEEPKVSVGDSSPADRQAVTSIDTAGSDTSGSDTADTNTVEVAR